jgi:hypothetical protein
VRSPNRGPLSRQKTRTLKNAFNPTLFSDMLPAPVALHRDRRCQVSDRGRFREMSLRGTWQSSLADIAQQFSVERVIADIDDRWNGKSIAFLSELPPSVRAVVLAPAAEVDWSPLESARALESITLYVAKGAVPTAVDFSKLKRLRICSIPWFPQWDSIRRCTSLQSLTLRDSTELQALDLRDLVRLQELILEGLFALERLELASDAKIRSLKVAGCPKLRLDLDRLTDTLESIWLSGKLAFSPGALAKARHLQKVMLTHIPGREPLPPFLIHLPQLVGVDVLSARLSKPDQELVAALHAKRRQQRQ